MLNSPSEQQSGINTDHRMNECGVVGTTGRTGIKPSWVQNVEIPRHLTNEIISRHHFFIIIIDYAITIMPLALSLCWWSSLVIIIIVSFKEEAAIEAIAITFHYFHYITITLMLPQFSISRDISHNEVEDIISWHSLMSLFHFVTPRSARLMMPIFRCSDARSYAIAADTPAGHWHACWCLRFITPWLRLQIFFFLMHYSD